MTIDLQLIIATGIAYLLYCLTLAGGIQVSINQVKPLFLDPIKNKLIEVDPLTAENRYLVVIYVFRTIITALAYFYLWGGVLATRSVLSGLVSTIPDVGIAIGTIALVVLGEEVIHPLVERLYVLKTITGDLGEVKVTIPVPSDNDTRTSTGGTTTVQSSVTTSQS